MINTGLQKLAALVRRCRPCMNDCINDCMHVVMKVCLIICMTISLQVASQASPARQLQVAVVGLFKDRAVLVIDGNQVMLRVGQTSKEGVMLLNADSRSAIVEINGTARKLILSREVVGGFKDVERTTVSVPQNNAGHYMAGGAVNGQPVRFLVDTGATVVALSSVHARRLGLRYEDGEEQMATTAGGDVTTFSITLDSVQVGEIRVDNVQAAVIEGEHPAEILLGMSFLDRVELQEARESSC